MKKYKMTKWRVFLSSLLMSGFLVLLIGMPSYAMEGITADNFNYVRYADTYPDLKAIYGYNKDALYNHYVNSGKAEGRVGCMSPTMGLTADKFDAAQYAKDNPDVAAALGNNAAAMYNHYLTSGLSEGRIGHSTDALLDSKLALYRTLNQITNASMTDEQKVKAVHDWICGYMSYGCVKYTGTNEIAPCTYSVVGTMKYQLGVCQAYAQTFKRCMDYLGIDSTYVSGTGTDPTDGSSGSHGWNQVLLNHTWYNIDVTWDDWDNFYGRVCDYSFYLNNSDSFNAYHVANKTITDITGYEYY